MQYVCVRREARRARATFFFLYILEITTTNYLLRRLLFGTMTTLSIKCKRQPR